MTFLTDVLHDLRLSRMLPVAVLLVLAVVLVPVFMLESAADQEPTPIALPALSATPGSGLPPLRLEQAGERRLSRLDAFSSKDPFGRPYRRRAESAAEGLTGDPGELAQSALGGGLGSPAGSSSSAFPPLVGGSSAGGGGSSGGAPPSGGPSGSGSSPDRDCPDFSTPEEAQGYFESKGGPASDPDRLDADRDGVACEDLPPKPPSDPLFTFRVDLRFGPGGKATDRRGVKRLTPLPSEQLPLLVFLGTNETGTEAVFLLDGQQLMPAGGRGECRPTPARCTFLSVRKGSAVALVDQEGTRYELKVVDIKLARVRPADSSDGADEIEPPPAGSEGYGGGQGSDGSPGSEGSDGSPDSGQSDDSTSPYDSENLRHRDEGSSLSFPDLFDLILDRR